MKESSLRSLISFNLERVVVLPRNVNSTRHTHDSSGPVCFALLAGRFIFDRVPRVADFAGFGV